MSSDIDAESAAQLLLAAWEGLQLQWQHWAESDIRAVRGAHALTAPTGEESSAR